jgi:hypothetical protein
MNLDHFRAFPFLYFILGTGMVRPSFSRLMREDYGAAGGIIILHGAAAGSALMAISQNMRNVRIASSGDCFLHLLKMHSFVIKNHVNQQNVFYISGLLLFDILVDFNKI